MEVSYPQQQQFVKGFDEQAFLALNATKNGRQQAFNQLVDGYGTLVYQIIRRMVLSHDDAKDLTQDCFLKVWKGLADFRGESRVNTWVYRIATNTALNFLRKQKRVYHVPLDSVEHGLAAALDQDPLFDGDEAVKKLQVAIAALPEKQKAVFILRYYDELPFQEISEMTGTSVGALKANYHHAVKKIESALVAQ